MSLLAHGRVLEGGGEWCSVENAAGWPGQAVRRPREVKEEGLL